MQTRAVHAFAFDRGTQGWVATLADELIEELLSPAAEERRAMTAGGVFCADAALAALMTQILAEFEGTATAGLWVMQGLCTVPPGSGLAADRGPADAPGTAAGLAHTSLPASTIACTPGFADPACFSRVFSGVEGLSPRALRERLVSGRLH